MSEGAAWLRPSPCSSNPAPALPVASDEDEYWRATTGDTRVAAAVAAAAAQSNAAVAEAQLKNVSSALSMQSEEAARSLRLRQGSMPGALTKDASSARDEKQAETLKRPASAVAPASEEAANYESRKRPASAVAPASEEETANYESSESDPVGDWGDGSDAEDSARSAAKRPAGQASGMLRRPSASTSVMKRPSARTSESVLTRPMAGAAGKDEAPDANAKSFAGRRGPGEGSTMAFAWKATVNRWFHHFGRNVQYPGGRMEGQRLLWQHVKTKVMEAKLARPSVDVEDLADNLARGWIHNAADDLWDNHQIKLLNMKNMKWYPADA